MSGFLGNNYFIHSHGAAASHLDRGLYSSKNGMWGNPPSTNDQIATYSFGYFYRHDFSISSTNALAFAKAPAIVCPDAKSVYVVEPLCPPT